MARGESPVSNGLTSAATEPSSPRPADDNAAAAAAATPRQRKRRRVLSCRACQKVKCRCDHDPLAQTQACRRCLNLRVACSLAAAGDASTAGPAGVANPTNPLTTIGPVEDRLRQHDASLAEIKDLLQTLIAQTRKAEQLLPSPPSPPPPTVHHHHHHHPNTEIGDPEHISDPADEDIDAAPVAVVRMLGPSIAIDGGRRRLPQQAGLDIVASGVIDEATAGELFRTFLQHGSSNLITFDAHQYDNPALLQQQLRRASPFLFSVACLMGFRYLRRAGATQRLNHAVYESVRVALGQVVLMSPLPLHEVNAILIVSSCGASPIQHGGFEYIDGWLASGYCVQHAMLSIHFAAIVGRVRRGGATCTDARALRLWCHICVDHLEWAAMTGRPHGLAPHYLRQCTALLNVYHATMQDGMTVATTLLYDTLHCQLAALAARPPGGEATEGAGDDGFASWKTRWQHLFTLPRASLLKLSYFTARLIYATRAADEPWVEDALGLASPADGSRTSSLRSPADDTQPKESAACRYAALVVQTYNNMEPALLNEVSTHMMMCVVYASLTLARRCQQTALPRAFVLGLLRAQNQRCTASVIATPLIKWIVCEALRSLEAQTDAGPSQAQEPQALQLQDETALHAHLFDGQRSQALDAAYGGASDDFAYPVDAADALANDTNTVFSVMEAYFAGAYGPLDEL